MEEGSKTILGSGQGSRCSAWAGLSGTEGIPPQPSQAVRLLQAFLQRVVNSGGRIEREYGLGRRCTDLLILWPRPGQARPGQAVQRAVVGCKLLYKSLEQTVREGLEQTRAYMDRCAADGGHLVVFDRTPGLWWEDRIFRRDEGEPRVTVWGM